MLSKTAMRLALATNSGIEYIKKVPVIDFLRIYEDLLEIVRGEEYWLKTDHNTVLRFCSERKKRRVFRVESMELKMN